jgi:hypothetical protein
MKSLLIATAVLAALPVLAEEQKAQSSTAAEQTPASKPESPLAAAARTSKRNDGKKRVIITNESLKDAKGHVSTSKTNIQLPLVAALPPAKTEKELIQEKADQKAAEAVRLAAEQKKKDTEQKRLARLARASEMAEGEDAGYGEEDPARAEKELEDASKPNPER